MTDHDQADQQPWWHESARQGPSPEDMADAASEVLGGAAQEAVRLVGAIQQRLAESAVPQPSPDRMDIGNGVGAMLSMLGQAASTFGAASPSQGARSASDSRPSGDSQSGQVRDEEVSNQSDGSADGPPAGPSDEHATDYVAPGQAAACSSCPVCQVIAAVRTIQPETVERMVNAVLDLAEAVQEVRPGAPNTSQRPAASPTININVEVEDETNSDSPADLRQSDEPIESAIDDDHEHPDQD